MEASLPYSYHVFLFPFIKKEKSNEISKVNWTEETFDPTTNVTHYNQHSYFYDFAENTMFNNPKSIVKAYRFNKLISHQSIYSIDIVGQSLPYDLHIDKIVLKEFEGFDVGVLGFYLANYTYNSDDDILKINEFGRRIYPQFLDPNTFVNGTKNAFLANRITLKNLLMADVLEDFSEFEQLPIKENYLPQHITQLIGTEIKEALDDRMFVCCFYGNQSVINELKIWDEQKEKYAYLENDFWYKFIFLDKEEPTCYSNLMRNELTSAATYNRWIDYLNEGTTSGTLYGVSRYSFMILGSSFSLENLKSMYSEMATLCLVQRATLLSFSDKITTISNDGIESKEVSSLYKSYIQFRNQLYFREVTAQEQGIELYDLLQKQMRLEKEVKDLDEEISELNSYIQTEEQGGLTKVASLFLPASFIAAILTFISDKDYFQFGKISFSPKIGYTDITLRYVLLFGIVLIGFLIGYIISNPQNIKRLWKK